MASRSNITATMKGGMRTGNRHVSVSPVKMICGPAYDGAVHVERTEAQDKAKARRVNKILKGKLP